IRTIAFAWCFLVLGLVFWERHAGGIAWSLLALQFIAYPHLAYWRAIKSRNSRDAEMQNLLIDPALLGLWMAALGFPAWVTSAALFSPVLNNVVIRGALGAAAAAICFAAGALAWIAPMGLERWVATTPLVTALCFLGSLAYACGVGAVVYQQNQRLRRARD